MTDVRTIASGIRMGESARWHGGELWFADWLQGTICRVVDGEVTIEAHVPSFPICFDWLADGRLLVVSGRECTISVVGTDGELAEFAQLGSVSPFPWNEIVAHPAGFAFANGVGFDFPGPPEVAGVIVLVDADGTTTAVADGLAFPNGMAVSPDGSVLVVAESHAGRLTAFDILPDGTLVRRRVWADIPGSAPDGICWDASSGGIWFAEVPGARCVLVAEGGEIIREIALEQASFSCVVGTNFDGRPELYAVTAPWPDAMNPTLPAGGHVVAALL